jgi:hypothetical protein
MPVPSRRTFLRWFHQLEDDPLGGRALTNGWELIRAALNHELITADDQDGFARLVFDMGDDDLVDFDHVARGLDQFGHNASYELQQATNFRSTSKGRQWLADTSSGVALSIHESTIGQLAAGDITNLTVVQLLEAAEAELDELPAADNEREEARALLTRFVEAQPRSAPGLAAGLSRRHWPRCLASADRRPHA